MGLVVVGQNRFENMEESGGFREWVLIGTVPTMSVRYSVTTVPKAPREIWDLDDPELEPGSILLETAIKPQRYGLD